MSTFTRARFEAYCARFAPEFRAAALAAATLAPDTVTIPSDHLAALARRYPPIPRPPPEKPRGLGDVVATLAEPIARLSDRHLGTHLVGCQSCAERRAALNKAVSFKR